MRAKSPFISLSAAFPAAVLTENASPKPWWLLRARKRDVTRLLLHASKVKVTRLAHGVPVGGELDYLDEGTLTAAIRQRTAL